MFFSIVTFLSIIVFLKCMSCGRVFLCFICFSGKETLVSLPSWNKTRMEQRDWKFVRRVRHWG